MQMLDFALVKDSKVCRLTYFGEGVVYQSVHDVKTQQNNAIPIYRDDKKAADKFIVREVVRMLNEGWDLADED
jgi:hypothetical protein